MGNNNSKASRRRKTTRALKKNDIISPTPADIDIAQSVVPLPISDIATSLGLRSNEVDLYGPTKAKVKLNVLDRLGGDNAPNGRYTSVFISSYLCTICGSSDGRLWKIFHTSSRSPFIRSWTVFLGFIH